ncbi:MAG: TolC family protein [Thermoguttaceae bacterium]
MSSRTVAAAAGLLLGSLLAATASAENLGEAWATALAADQRLAAAQWMVSASREGARSARAELLPTASAEVSYDLHDKDQEYRLTTTGGTVDLPISQRDSVGTKLAVVQPVYTFGRIRENIKAADARVCVAQFELSERVQQIKLTVAQDYADVLLNQRRVEVDRAAVESLASHLKDVRNRIEQGMAISNALLASEVALANARQRLLEDQNALDNARSNYNRALVRPLNAPVGLEELAEPNDRPDLDLFTQRALEQRPELVRLSCQAADLQSRAASIRATYCPQLSVEGADEYQQNSFQVNPQVATFSLKGEWRFFDSGRRRHEATRLDEEASAVHHDRADEMSVIALQVRQAWTNLASRRERVLVNRAALNSADENVRVTRERFNEGIGTNTDVLDAETLRTQVYRNYYDSVYSSLVAYWHLRWAAGEL